MVFLIGGGFKGDLAHPDKFALTVTMTRILFPFILFVSVAAVVMGMLNSRHIFGIPASASTLFNIISVISGVTLACLFDPQKDWLHPHFGEKAVYAWCFGVLLGGLAQLAIQLPSLWSLGFRYKWALDFRNPALQTILMLMVPSAIAGSGRPGQRGGELRIRLAQSRRDVVALLRLSPRAIAHRHFRRRHRNGHAARRRTPARPRRFESLRQDLEDALRFGFYLTLPASVGLAAVAQPVIQLIYEHGSFTARSTYETALALQAYTIGIAGYSGIKILVPCFYAMQPPRFESRPKSSFWSSFSHFVMNVILFTPARVSLIGIALNLVLCFVLYYYLGLGHVGLALTTGFVAILNFLQLVYAIQKKIDLGAAGDWLSFFARVTVATLACGCIVLVGDQVFLAHRTTHSLLGAAILFLNIGVAGAVYFGLTLLFRVPESVELVSFIKRKFGRILIPEINHFCGIGSIALA